MPSIIIIGPTAVGKSALAQEIAARIGGQIINADSAQFYTPLTIGTAKPAYQESNIVHHCFDLVNEPVNYSVTAYRANVQEVMGKIYQQGQVPIIVGGSGFYIKSLLYPPSDYNYNKTSSMAKSGEVRHSLGDGGTSVGGWQQLQAIDPVRAAEIHPHDTYRITRALTIWQQTGMLPSACKLLFAPLDDMLIVWVTREREQLYKYINERTHAMIDAGWIEETRALPAEWKQWLKEKKIIGYDTICDFLEGTIATKEQLIGIIQRKTRNYAKGQETFWKSFKRQLETSLATYSGARQIQLMEISLTLATHDLYINQLLARYDQLRMQLKDKDEHDP